MLINGVNPSTYGFTLSDPPAWLDAPTYTIPSAVISGRGSRQVGAPIPQPRRVQLRGWVQGSTATVARTNLDLLKLAVSAETVNLSFNDHIDRYYATVLESFAVPPLPSGAYLTKKIQLTITMVALDPYAYDIAPAGTFFTGDLVLGTAPVRPVLQGGTVLLAGSLDVSLVDYLGNVVQTMSIAHGMGGDWLVIDNDNQVITADGTDITADMTGDFFTVDPLLHANFGSSLWPHFEKNAFSGSGGPDAISYRKAWL